MRRVRRGTPRRGPRRSYLANVNPSSISIGNVSRNIRSKLKEIKSYQVPRFQGATGYSAPYNEDENTRDFDQQASYGNPSREQNQQQGARYGSYNRDQREEQQDTQPKSYYDQQGNLVQRGSAPQGEQSPYYGSKQGESYGQEVTVPSYVTRPQGHEEEKYIVKEQRNVPAYTDNHYSKVVHLEPDEEYILSTSGNSRKVTTLEKRVKHSPSAYVQAPAHHSRQGSCPYCGRETGVQVYQVNADCYQERHYGCSCSNVRVVQEAPVSHAYTTQVRPVAQPTERVDYHCCSSHPVAEREYGYVVRPSCDDRREKRPRTYNIYIH